MEGIINVLKPPGMTSHDVVAFLRRTLREKKIGHCGTLDPQAAGVLPVCLGQATKLADYLSGGEKSYYGEMELGRETDTQDIWGETAAVFPAPDLDSPGALEKVRACAKSLEGWILQEVPAYSAVKKEGQSLHRLARAGKPLTGMERRVLVRSFQIEGCGGGKIRFVTECGAGTYVRMLCRDLGRSLGSGGVMCFLLRLRVGPFRLEDSVTLEEIVRQTEAESTKAAKAADTRAAETAVKSAAETAGGAFAAAPAFLAPKELALTGLPRLQAGEGEALRLRRGQTVWLDASGREGSEGRAPSLNVNPKSSLQEYKAYVLDQDRRLAAIGLCRPGGGAPGGAAGERAGENTGGGFAGPAGRRILFKPEKTFI